MVSLLFLISEKSLRELLRSESLRLPTHFDPTLSRGQSGKHRGDLSQPLFQFQAQICLQIGVFIADTMKLDLKQITNSLQINQRTWYNASTAKLDGLGQDRGHGTADVAHYHGEHRQ